MNSAVLGNYSLAAAALASSGGVLAAVSAGRFGSERMLHLARLAIYAVTAALTVASAVLLGAILTNDFLLKYVAGHSDRALPWGYKISAFWAGHEGSLLLWAWMLAAMACLAVFLRRKQATSEQAPIIALLAAMCGAFTVLMLFAARPE